MCGIAGIVSQSPGRYAAQQLREATACMQHRGPEGAGTWSNPEQTVFLGHRRLRIIDLSPAAAQPMAYTGRYRIVHNGELYNYIELREVLRKKGYAFDTASDTEVIVAAYDAWGAECLQLFDGMFAFAIWDEKERALFAARDRFGEKPFFFSFEGQDLVFASEMKTLWQLGISREVNRALLYNFLTIGYTTNPADPQETFFAHIQKLPAGSFFRYTPGIAELSIEKYGVKEMPEQEVFSEEAAVEKFRALFSESVRRRMRSDVAVGTSLSGGLDSSAVVAFCDRFTTDAYSHKCFTASFGDYEKNEREQAAVVARQHGLEHIVVEMDGTDLVPLMQKLMHHQEEPVTSASVAAQFRVYEAARRHGVTVLLDGQGADEVLAGYQKYYRWWWQQLYRQRKLRKSGERKAAEERGITVPFSVTDKAAALFPELAAGLQQSRKSRQAFHHPDLDRDFAFTHKRSLYYATPATFDLNGALYFNTYVHGLEELLRYADRNAMAHGTEVRLPFLSHELVAFLFSLPPQHKIHQGWTKWLLRKTVDGMLPREIVWRKDKVGFEPPQKKWMEQPGVQEAIREARKKLVDEKILDPSVLYKKIQPHDAYAAESLDWRYWSASFLY